MKVIFLILLISNANFVFFGQLQAINIESIIDKRIDAKEMKVKREDVYFFDLSNNTELRNYFYEYDSSLNIIEEYALVRDSVFYNNKYVNFYNKNNQPTLIKSGNSMSNIFDDFLGVSYLYKNTVKLSKEYRSINSSDFIYYDSLGNDTSEVCCFDNNCYNVLTKEYEKYNLISFVTYNFDNKIVYKKVYSYDSLNRMISSQLILYDTLGESFYNLFNGDLLFNYAFLPNKEIIIRKEIIYKENRITILYYDKESNFEALYYLLDEQNNVISKKGYDPTQYPCNINEKRIFKYDDKGRIIQKDIYIDLKITFGIQYSY